MYRPWKAIALAAAVLLLVGTFSAISIASAAPQNQATSKTKVLHLISHQVSLQVIDLGKKGDSAGDQVLESTVEFQNGHRVGRSVLTCGAITFSSTRGPDALCHGATVFDDGQIEFQGETTFTTPFTVAVTGGTGRYQSVGGQLTVERTLPNGIDDVETLRLIFFDTN
jgi:hypothetical protein